MSSYLEKKRKIDEAISDYSRTTVGKRLKGMALIAFAICVFLQLAVAFWNDSLSLTARLVMRGCAGLCGLIFVVLMGVLIYKANSTAMKG